MRFTVGGEEYDLTKDRVILAMRGASSEPIRKHLVEIDGADFPPKQVFATVTGRPRTSFTTMEAQRVLHRLGFVCREAGQHDKGAAMWSSAGGGGSESGDGIFDRLTSVEARLGTLEAAVAGLQARMKELEAVR
jgi:hypothetical protein